MMYAAYGRNTMLGAQRIAAQKGVVPMITHQSRTAEEMRAERRARNAAEAKAWAENLALRKRDLHEKQIAQAREIIAKGRAAARRFNGADRDAEKFAAICRRLCKVFGVSMREVCGDRRNKEVVICRQAIIYWTVRQTCFSYPYIGRAIGGRDHTTCLAAARAYREKRLKVGRKLMAAR